MRPPCSLAEPAPPRPTHPVHATYLVRPTHLAYLTCIGLAVVLLWPTGARAQIYESVGTRAQGMGGAFVAVADDASATWWNPAGLAMGAFFSSVLEHDNAQDPRQPIDGS